MRDREPRSPYQLRFKSKTPPRRPSLFVSALEKSALGRATAEFDQVKLAIAVQVRCARIALARADSASLGRVSGLRAGNGVRWLRRDGFKVSASLLGSSPVRRSRRPSATKIPANSANKESGWRSAQQVMK